MFLEMFLSMKGQTHRLWTLSKCACLVLTCDCAEVRTLKVVLISVKTTLPLVVKIKILTKSLWLINLWCWDQIINAICVSEILKFQLYLIHIFSIPNWVQVWAELFYFYSYFSSWESFLLHTSDLIPFFQTSAGFPEKKKKTKLIIRIVVLYQQFFRALHLGCDLWSYLHYACNVYCKNQSLTLKLYTGNIKVN